LKTKLSVKDIIKYQALIKEEPSMKQQLMELFSPSIVDEIISYKKPVPMIKKIIKKIVESEFFSIILVCGFILLAAISFILYFYITYSPGGMNP
jgi:hypothetical protein